MIRKNERNYVELNGWKIDRGDRVLLACSSVNRDEKIFDQPDELQIEHLPNRHVGFGAGTHRCISSFYARVMFEAMGDDVLQRTPDYTTVDTARSIAYPSVAQVNGWISSPATFTPGKKLGGRSQLLTHPTCRKFHSGA